MRMLESGRRRKGLSYRRTTRADRDLDEGQGRHRGGQPEKGSQVQDFARNSLGRLAWEEIADKR